MTLSEYIEQTRSTDLVGTVKHAALGLISEVGEVYGVLAKIERGDRIDRVERMTAELGDVAWYLARLTVLCRCPTPDLSVDCWAWALFHNTYSAAHHIAARAYVVLTQPDNGLSAEQVAQCWAWWARLCQIEGLDPSTVLSANLVKLRDRQARRVLQGDGDHR